MLASRHLIAKTDRYELWKSFVDEGKVPERVDPAIAASWQRCRGADLSPVKDNISSVLPADQILTLLDNNSLLLATARSNLQVLERSLGAIPYVLFLCDPQGYIIYEAGADPLLDLFHQTGKPGSNCSENIIGTTAPGIVLAEKKPSVVLQEEHYSNIYHWCCCAASPILDSRGDILACLNIMTSKDHLAHFNLLACLGLITSRFIQRELQMAEQFIKMERSHAVSGDILNCLDEPLLIANKNGIVTHANRPASDLVRVPPDLLIGRHFQEFIDSEPIESCLRKEIRRRGKAHIRHSGDGRGSVSVKVEPLHDGSAEFIGGVVLFREEKRSWSFQNNEMHPAPFTFESVIGESAGMKKAIDLGKVFAASDTPVLLHGETGTGKELFAQAIHNLSPRRNKPFIPVNCAAIPEALAESELFGYRKGAFTGAALEGKKGKFEMADGGTLFLDEINSMPLELQAKLLRAVEAGEIVRLGDHTYKHVNVRIIASINDSLEGAGPPPGLRKDLFYRIASVRIDLPPLRQRPGDLEKLAFFFMAQMSNKVKKQLKGVQPKALQILKGHTWPGNIRELKSCIEFAVQVADSDILCVEHLPDYLTATTNDAWKKPASASEVIDAAERALLMQSLVDCEGKIANAASSLGISRSTFYRKCKKLGLDA